MRNAGYETAYYYGGEMEFANMKSYFRNGFEHLVDMYAFDENDRNSKWGVHDHVVLERFETDINQAKQPFFYTLFTLSSHEPYEYPKAPYFEGSDNETLFLNSLRYTDESIFDFIQKAKQSGWWDETLIVIMADHGHPFPGSSEPHDPEKYHVPMLWLGGAVDQRGLVINKIASQTDIPATILSQLDISSKQFVWSEDIMNPSYAGRAFFNFKNGFGVITAGDTAIYDAIGDKVIKLSSKSEDALNQGKALSQQVYDFFLGL